MAQAAQQAGADDQGTDAGEPEEPEEQPASPSQLEQAQQVLQVQRQRKRQQEAAISKIKKGKKFAKRKKSLHGEPGEDDDDELAWDMYQKSKPLPGQLENCELCGKRFTVTAYSATGPDGGLLCTPCSKQQSDEKKKNDRNKKGRVAREKRRKLQSNLLDGLAPHGAKTLKELCVEKVARHIKDVDEFGDLPPRLLDRLSQILSKKRFMTSETLNLFLGGDRDRLAIYDAAQLLTDDFIRILAMCPNLERLTLNLCGQFKDAVVDYMLQRPNKIKHLKMEECNLVTDDKWRELFDTMGHQLLTLKLTWLDSSFDDETVEHLVKGCPNLTYLKLKKCFRLTTSSLRSLARLTKLEHLALEYKLPVENDDLRALIEALGGDLRTLSLERFVDADDSVLDVIKASCGRLQKLRLTSNARMTDQALGRLFEGWAAPALMSVDLHDTRSINAIQPDGDPDPDELVGLAQGLSRMMEHTGGRLEKLNIKGCRHIPLKTLLDVFDGMKQYPQLREIDMSFVRYADTTVIAGLFKSCPNVRKVVAFGCFAVGEVVVPQGVALIGVPLMQYGMEQKGDFYVD